MKIFAVLADTGKPGFSNNISLLNAGWSFTTAMPLPAGDYTLPGQALAVFLEAPWDALNKPHAAVIELLDDEMHHAELSDPESGGWKQAKIEVPITVPPVPGAPNGMPGYAHLVIDLPPGAIRIPSARRRYLWRITIGESQGEVGFWVDLPPPQPKVG
jgi:hypothetical protein